MSTKLSTALAMTLLLPLPALASEAREKPSMEEYLRGSVTSREAIEKSLRDYDRWQFDSELGVIDGAYDGERGHILSGAIDGSTNVGTFQANSARTAFLYIDRKPRINTYGDSFTHGDQVNDGETWQEYLAGHLREPVGNFGVGGYGVYQAYRRMLREEKSDHGAKYLILTICCDDSTRTLFRSWYPLSRQVTRRIFAGAKPNVEMDLKAGHFVEKENLLPSRESLYHLTEPEWMVENFGGDLALQLQLYGGQGQWARGQAIQGLDRKKVTRLAALLDFPFDWTLDTQRNTVSYYPGQSPVTPMRAQALALLNRYSQRATIYILDKARQFAEQSGKKLLVVLVVNTDGSVLERGGSRANQEVVDHLKKNGFDYFDMDEALIADYRKAQTQLTYVEYFRKYMVNGSGHLNPSGNHFFAYALKSKMIDWLDPKPRTYQQREANKHDKDYFFNATPNAKE